MQFSAFMQFSFSVIHKTRVLWSGCLTKPFDELIVFPSDDFKEFFFEDFINYFGSASFYVKHEA